MARMRERLGGGLRPPTRLDGRRVRRRGGDEVDIDDARGGPSSGVNQQLDMATALLIRAWLGPRLNPPPSSTTRSKKSFSIARKAFNDIDVGTVLRRVVSERGINLSHPVEHITHYRTSVLHLCIVLRHLSIVQSSLRMLARPSNGALAFSC